MASKTHHRRGANSTFRDAWIRTFGTSLEAPKASAKLKIAVAILALLGTGVATAAWQVNDRETQTQIKEVQKRLGDNGTVTDQLNNLNSKLKVDKPDGTMPKMIVEPTDQEGLNETQPSSTPVAIDKLCTAGAMTVLGQQQQGLCREIANTELAQYRFSLRMFKRASKNYEHLEEIEKHRRSLGEDDYGKIQQNTNELLALTAHMDNDRDRYQTYMAAYSARMVHIRNSQTALTRNALKGSGSLSLTSLL